MEQEADKKMSQFSKWIKRFGVAGFMFFFIKGLVWLVIIFGGAYFGFDFLKK